VRQFALKGLDRSRHCHTRPMFLRCEIANSSMWHPPATCHHGGRNQPLANRILGKRNAACRDALLPLRSSQFRAA
jgi:hypothetical protein